MSEIFETGLINRVETLGNYFISKLNIIQERYSDIVKEVRGFGLMIGVELKSDCSNIVKSFRDNGILVNCTSENVIRILPPLISTKENIDNFLKIFVEILKMSK